MLPGSTAPVAARNGNVRAGRVICATSICVRVTQLSQDRVVNSHSTARSRGMAHFRVTWTSRRELVRCSGEISRGLELAELRALSVDAVRQGCLLVRNDPACDFRWQI